MLTNYRNGLPSTNADEQYDAASEHSQDECGMHPTLVSLMESGLIPTGANSKNAKEKLLDGSCSRTVENRHLRPSVTAPSSEIRHSSVSQVQDGVCLPSTSLNPFALKATNEDSFGPRRQVSANHGSPGLKGSQFISWESDNFPVLTETSEDEPSSGQLSMKMSVRPGSTC